MKTSKKRKSSGKILKKTRAAKAIDYKEGLLEDLKDLDYAAGYLTAALEEGEEVFLLAVRDVAQAQGGMSALAKSTNLNRENLYDMLSESGNPRFLSLTSILDKLGLQVEFKAKLHGSKAA